MELGPEFRPPPQPPGLPSQPPRPPKQPTWIGPFILGLILAMAGFWLLNRYYFQRGSPVVEPRAVTARGELSEAEKANIKIYSQTTPSVVNVTTSDESFDFWTGRTQEVPRGTGTGIVWDKGGDIVTNFHVVQDATQGNGRLYVTLWNHERYSAEIVGVAPDYDLAVIRIDAPADKLTPILIGKSQDLKVGQSTYAIGNPFGLDQTMTTGIVSAVGRAIRSVTHKPIQNVIQTDAPINPGNSGGPLLDSAGLLIGVNTAIVSPSGSSAGIGFAIPVDTVNKVVPQLIRKGQVYTPDPGIVARDVWTQQLTNVPGVLVFRVAPNSPASAAGLQPTRISGRQIKLGDIIVKVGDKRVTSVADMNAAFQDYQPGDTVTLTVIRDGQETTVPLKMPAQ